MRLGSLALSAGCSFPTPGCSALLGSVGARFAAAGVGENGDDRGLPSRDSVPPWPSNADWASGGIAQSCAWLAAPGRPTIRRVIRPADGFIAHEIAPPTGMADGAAKMMLASPCVLDAKSKRRVVPARAYRARGRAGRSRRPRLRFGPPNSGIASGVAGLTALVTSTSPTVPGCDVANTRTPPVRVRALIAALEIMSMYQVKRPVEFLSNPSRVAVLMAPRARSANPMMTPAGPFLSWARPAAILPISAARCTLFPDVILVSQMIGSRSRPERTPDRCVWRRGNRLVRVGELRK